MVAYDRDEQFAISKIYTFKSSQNSIEQIIVYIDFLWMLQK